MRLYSDERKQWQEMLRSRWMVVVMRSATGCTVQLWSWSTLVAVVVSIIALMV